MNIIIRPYKPKDARVFAEIHYEAVHKLAKNHYPDYIVDDWSAPIECVRMKKMIRE